jgi:hypothetical protein
LRGSPVLEYAAFQIVQTLKDHKMSDILLHFFYGSTTCTMVPYINKHLVCVWTLIMQIVDSIPLSDQEYILAAFFSQALELIECNKLEEMAVKGPMKHFNLYYASAI